MRNFVIALVIALLHCGTAWSQGIITSFSAQPAGDHAVLEWTSGSEAGLSIYQIERSLDGLEFISVAQVSPMGNLSSYIYEDYPLYKESTRIFYYRVRVIMTNGSSSLSSVKIVTLSFSGIQQTWGSIKALFK